MRPPLLLKCIRLFQGPFPPGFPDVGRGYYVTEKFNSFTGLLLLLNCLPLLGQFPEKRVEAIAAQPVKLISIAKIQIVP